MKSKIKKNILNICKIIFTTLFVFMLAKTVNVTEIKKLFLELDAKTVTISFALYLIIYVVRSCRFLILLTGRLKLKNMLPVLLVHGMYNRVLPFRIGESVFPYMLSKFYKIDVSESTTVLILARIYDLVSTLVFFFVFYLSSQLGFNTIILLFMLTMISILSVLLVWVMGKFVKYMMNIGKDFTKYKFIYKIRDALASSMSMKKIGMLMTLSMLNWLILFVFFYMISNALGFDIQLENIVLAGSFSNLSSILPISSLGNFGTMELGWSAILVAKGYSYEQAMLHGFLLNTSTFLCVLVLGIVGVVYTKLHLNEKEG